MGGADKSRSRSEEGRDRRKIDTSGIASPRLENSAHTAGGSMCTNGIDMRWSFENLQSLRNGFLEFLGIQLS